MSRYFHMIALLLLLSLALTTFAYGADVTREAQNNTVSETVRTLTGSIEPVTTEPGSDTRERNDHGNLSAIRTFVTERDNQLAQQMRQYVRGRAAPDVQEEINELSWDMRNWVEATFAHRSRVQALEQETRRLQKQIDYLKAATNHSELDVNMAAHVMADHGYEELRYGEQRCYVYQNTYNNHTSPKRVQCIR